MKWTTKLSILFMLVTILIMSIGMNAYAQSTYAAQPRNEGECWYWMNQAHEGAEIARRIGGDNAAVLKYYGDAWTEFNNLRKEMVQRKQEEAQRAAEEAARKAEEQKSNLVSLGTFTITHYCPCSICNGGYTGTATGAPLTPGETIAVDPSVIPYWSHVMINGHEYIAEDCGGHIKGHHIDLLVGDHSTALAKGTIKAEVFLVK